MAATAQPEKVYYYTEAVGRRYSVKKVFLKIHRKFTGKHRCQSLLFNKVE